VRSKGKGEREKCVGCSTKSARNNSRSDGFDSFAYKSRIVYMSRIITCDRHRHSSTARWDLPGQPKVMKYQQVWIRGTYPVKAENLAVEEGLVLLLLRLPGSLRLYTNKQTNKQTCTLKSISLNLKEDEVCCNEAMKRTTSLKENGF